MAFGSMNGHDDADMSDINVTPLVDVMLVLMIVFMISMPVFTSAIRIDLPKTNQTTQMEKKEIVRVTINDKGEYFIQDALITPERLAGALAQMRQEHKDVILAVHADKQAQYEALAQLLNTARLEGIHKIGFITQVQGQTKP